MCRWQIDKSQLVFNKQKTNKKQAEKQTREDLLAS
jgi:hypothetical protein